MSQAKQLASHLSGYGRYGDSMLMHVNPEEVRALNMMAGIAGRHITTNPDTGLPEAFNLFDILPFAIDLIAPGMGTAAKIAVGAASGAASSAIEGGNPLTGALTGGVMSGIGSNIFGGAGPAETAVKASTDAASRAGSEAFSQVAKTAGADAAASAAERAVLDGIEKASVPGNSSTYLTDIFGEGSDAFADRLFSSQNLPLTIGGASLLGSMIPEQGYKEEGESSGPRGEYRPGQGYVPFQQAGERFYNPGMISPTGVEQSWIGYGPSADPSTYRRFANGGPVTASTADQIAAIRGASMPGPVTGPTGGGKAGGINSQGFRDRFKQRYGSPDPNSVKGRKAGRVFGNETMQPMPRPTSPSVTPPNPLSTIQGGTQGGTAAFTPAMPSPVGTGGYIHAAYQRLMQQPMPEIQTPPSSVMTPVGPTIQGFAEGGLVPNGNGQSGKGGFESQTQKVEAPKGLNIKIEGFADGGEVKRNPFDDFFTSGPMMGAVPWAINKIADGDWKLGLLGLPNLMKDLSRDKRGTVATPGPEMPGQTAPGMRNGGYVRRYADGGPIMGGIAQGMMPNMPPPPNPAPMGVPMNAPIPQGMPQVDDQTLVQAAAAVLSGQIPNGEPIIQLFVAKFGPDALQQLMQMVSPPIPDNMGRLLRGPGDGRSDSIPASIDGVAPAKLSTGEFVVPAKAVSKLGRGSTEAGAKKLQSMVNKVNRKPIDGAPEVIDDMEPMRA